MCDVDVSSDLGVRAFSEQTADRVAAFAQLVVVRSPQVGWRHDGPAFFSGCHRRPVGWLSTAAGRNPSRPLITTSVMYCYVGSDIRRCSTAAAVAAASALVTSPLPWTPPSSRSRPLFTTGDSDCGVFLSFANRFAYKLIIEISLLSPLSPQNLSAADSSLCSAVIELSLTYP